MEEPAVHGLVGPADMDDSCDDAVREMAGEPRWTASQEWQHEVASPSPPPSSSVRGGLAHEPSPRWTRTGADEIRRGGLEAPTVRRLPSLAVLSGQSAVRWIKSFDADGSGQVDAAEFEHRLNATCLAVARRSRTRRRRGTSAEGKKRGGGKKRRGKKPRWRLRAGGSRARAPGHEVEIGIQWDTSFGRRAKATMADHMERTLADAIAHLFYTHRRELFHAWHAIFGRDGSIGKDEFIASSCARWTPPGGAQMLSEDALRGLAETLDSNGDARATSPSSRGTSRGAASSACTARGEARRSAPEARARPSRVRSSPW